MKTVKKIIFIALALLPLLPMICGLLSALNGNADLSERQFGNISFDVVGSTYYAKTEEGTWIHYLCPNINGSEGNSTKNIFKLYQITNAISNFGNESQLKFPKVYELDDNSIDGRIFVSCTLLLYESLIYFLNMIFSVITWIPKKMEDVFR